MPLRFALTFVLILTSMMAASPNLNAQTYSLVIGTDGLSPYGLDAGAAPNIQSLINGSWAGVGTGYRGSLTNHAYSGGTIGTSTQQATVSGPGWSSILTGVWIDQHGVTNNNFTGSQFQTRPSYLKILESQVAGIHTAGVVTWAPINDSIFAPDGVNPNLDYRLSSGSDLFTTSQAIGQVTGFSSSSNGALFIQLDDIDIAGHSSGLYSTNYLGQVADVDSQIGQILTAIRNRPTFSGENWQVALVSDHGHVAGGGHGGQSTMERTVPLIVSSKNVVQGFSPAVNRQSSLVDISATVFNHFGVSTPAGQAGQPLGSSAIDLTNRPSLASGLVSHIAFEGNSAGSPGTSGGTATGNVQYEAGRFGQAAKVQTYGAGLIRTDQDLGATFGTNSDFAMSLWMKYDSMTGVDPAFFSNKNWNSGSNTGINLALLPAGGGSLDFNTIAAGGTRRDIEPLGGLNAGDWNHILFNVDRDGRTLLYLNGILYGEIATTSLGSFDGAFNWTFFNDGTGTYTGGTITGLMIDEFGVWNRLLTNDEITYLSQSSILAVPEPNGLLVVSAMFAALAFRRRRAN